jgi:hypothetical protein
MNVLLNLKYHDYVSSENYPWVTDRTLHFQKFKIGQRLAVACMMGTVDGQLLI